MRSPRALEAVPPAWVWVAVVCLGCRGPTEVVVVLSTDLDCATRLETSIARGVPATIAVAAPATKTSSCSPTGQIGTLTFVPSGPRDERFSVRIVTAIGVPVETCRPPAYGKDCIVATRTLRYLPHTSLTMPIAMRGTCRGVVCPEGETCVRGACVPAEIDPALCATAAGCGEPEAPSADGGIIDPTPPPADAAAPPTDAAQTPPPPAPVVTARRFIAALAADLNGAYWTEPGDYSAANGGVYSVGAVGGAVRTVASGRESPAALATDGASVFWAELLGAGIVSAPLGGGAPTVLTIPGGLGVNMTAIALDDTFVYWNNEQVGVTNGVVRRAFKDGSGAQTLASNIVDGPWVLAIDGQSLAYVTASRFGGPGAVVSIPKSGGVPTTVSPLTGSYARARIALVNDKIAWVSTDSGGSVVAKTAAGISTVATGQSEVASLVADDTFVYWMTAPGAGLGAGSVMRAAWTGGPAQRLYDGVSTPGPMAVSPTSVYFVDNRASGADIARLAK